jgi:hypothetical protein
MMRYFIWMAMALAAFTSSAHAEGQGQRLQAYLWIEDVACMGDGGDNSELRIQASYYDSNRNRIDMPLFVQYSPTSQYPWAFSINRPTCDGLRVQVDRLHGQLLPVDVLRVPGHSIREVTYPCGPANHMTGDRGTCTKDVPVDTVYIQYELNGQLFTSWAE